VGKERKSREGYTNNARNKSFGYDRKDGELVQTVNEAEAEIVRMIFDMYVTQGMSLAAIAKSFNLQNIVSKCGGIWGSGSVKRVLTNCNYIGYVRYSMHDINRRFETEGKHEAIISEELYNAAQVLIKKNARTAPTKRPAESNFFVRLLYCSVCGSLLSPFNTAYSTKDSEKSFYAFFCRKSALKGGCNAKRLSANKVEKALVEYFARYDETFISDSEEAVRLELDKQKNNTQVQNYRKKLRVLDGKEKEVRNHYLNDTIDFESYREMKKQLDGDRDFIHTELAKITDDEDDNIPGTISREEVAASFKEGWERLTNAEKRLFLTKYIKKIVVRNEPIEGKVYGNTKVISVVFNSN
jgi:site-specific DNA recombinase